MLTNIVCPVASFTFHCSMVNCSISKFLNSLNKTTTQRGGGKKQDKIWLLCIDKKYQPASVLPSASDEGYCPHQEDYLERSLDLVDCLDSPPVCDHIHTHNMPMEVQEELVGIRILNPRIQVKTLGGKLGVGRVCAIKEKGYLASGCPFFP